METVRIESEQESKKPVTIVLPGWGKTIENAEKGLEVLNDNDRDVASLSHPRTEGIIFDRKTPEGSFPFDEYPKEVQRRATSDYRLIESEILRKMKSNKEQEIDINDNLEVDVIAHSMGALDSTLAVRMIKEDYPDVDIKMVLVSPAGLIGRDSVVGLGARFTGQIGESVEAKADPEVKKIVQLAGKEFFKYFNDNPARIVGETLAIAKTQTPELLKELKAEGVGITIMVGADEPTFPNKKITKNLIDLGHVKQKINFPATGYSVGEGKNAQTFHDPEQESNVKIESESDMFDGYVVVRGGHNKIYFYPEQYMALAEDLLTNMRNKKEEENK